MKLSGMKILVTTCLLPLLAGCATTPVASEFGDNPPVQTGSASVHPLDCGNPHSIKDFKDFVLHNLDSDPSVGEKWAVCVCGGAARSAGVNPRRPVPAEAVATVPAYDTSNPDESMALIRDWLKINLPLTEAQVTKLSDCLYK